MSTDKDMEAARTLVQWLIPRLKMPGLQVKGIGFDYLRQGYTVSFARHDHAATVLLPVERLEKLQSDAPFEIRHLRKQVEGALGGPET